MNSKWWIGSYIEVFEPDDSSSSESEVYVNENFILIAANSFEEAYNKLLEKSDIPHPVSSWKGIKGHWRHVGNACLQEILDNLEDGCELLWRQLTGYGRDDLPDLIYTKDELRKQMT